MHIFSWLIDIPVRSGRKKNVTIITYDAEPEMQIKDNLTRDGIDVRSLFNKVTLDFILTKEIYKGNEMELRKLDKLKDMMN